MVLYEVLRGAVIGYVGLLGLLGVTTLIWGLLQYGLRGEWIAAAWFAVGGSGLLLTAVLLVRYARGGDEEEAYL